MICDPELSFYSRNAGLAHLQLRDSDRAIQLWVVHGSATGSVDGQKSRKLQIPLLDGFQTSQIYRGCIQANSVALILGIENKMHSGITRSKGRGHVGRESVTVAREGKLKP